jgi:hypothetical protein
VCSSRSPHERSNKSQCLQWQSVLLLCVGVRSVQNSPSHCDRVVLKRLRSVAFGSVPRILGWSDLNSLPHCDRMAFKRFRSVAHLVRFCGFLVGSGLNSLFHCDRVTFNSTQTEAQQHCLLCSNPFAARFRRLPHAITRTVCLQSADFACASAMLIHTLSFSMSTIIHHDQHPPVIACSVAPSMLQSTNFRRPTLPPSEPKIAIDQSDSNQ